MSNNKKQNESTHSEVNKPKLTIKKGTFKRILSYIFKAYKFKFSMVIVGLILSSLASVAGSLFLKNLIDDYIVPLLGNQNPDYSGLLWAIGVLAAIYIVGIISSYVYNILMTIISQNVLKDIRDEMFCKMQDLPIRYFDENKHGDIMSHYTNDTDALEEMIGRSLPQIVMSTISIIAVLASMIYLNWILSLIVLAFTFATLLVTKEIAKKSSKYFISRQQSVGAVNGYVEEMLNGQKVIKVFTHEEKAKEGFDVLNDKLKDDMYKASKYMNILMPISANLGNIQYVLVAIIGTMLALNGKITLSLGTIISFLQLTRSFSHPVSMVMNQFNSIIQALAGASRIFDLIDTEPEIDDGYVTLVNIKKDGDKIIETKERTQLWAWKHQHHDGKLDYIELKGHIEFENVNFGYNKDKQILYDISLYAKPGQKIAFVGATGAGKTTITNLINRFYDIEDGKIRYDGINIKKIKKADLRKSLGMVLQDTNLFTGTIKDNIKYGNIDATDDEVIAAAKLANADSFIRRLPEGYDTVLKQNGSGLSGGQRQLISIARAAINNPPVMILDEATSSIDTRTEKIVQDGMDKLMKGRTVFVIAHRLSTVRNAKAILVMEHGKIIERGEHEDLMKNKGEYYELYTGAMELE